MELDLVQGIGFNAQRCAVECSNEYRVCDTINNFICVYEDMKASYNFGGKSFQPSSNNIGSRYLYVVKPSQSCTYNNG